MRVTDDKDNYYVEFDEDNWVYATVVVRKPCPLSALHQRAAACLTPSGVRQTLTTSADSLDHSSITPLQTKKVVVVQEQLDWLYQRLAETLGSPESRLAVASSSSRPESDE